MSTSCVFPLPVDDAFRLARSTGFDGVEIMVTQHRSTQDATALLALSARHELPILSIHAPVLPLAQFVWGGGPRGKLEGAARLAADVGASTVVVHPPYIWEPSFARAFGDTVRELADEYGVTIAVENMFALAFGPLRVAVHSPSPDPTRIDCDAMTLDFSHAAVAGRDALEFAISMGSRLKHIHLCDGTIGTDRLLDEHLVPGHGSQPVAEVLRYLAASNWNGSLIAEVHAARGATEAQLVEMLSETVRFTRQATATEVPQPSAAATPVRP